MPIGLVCLQKFHGIGPAVIARLAEIWSPNQSWWSHAYFFPGYQRNAYLPGGFVTQVACILGVRDKPIRGEALEIDQ
jgi:hypothetical protein